MRYDKIKNELKDGGSGEGQIGIVKNNKKCWGRDLNPRPFGIEPESTALDHSATSTFLSLMLKLSISLNS